VRGSGESEPCERRKKENDQFTFDTYVEDAHYLLSQVADEKQISLFVCGMAWGSRPAFVYASKYAEKVSGLMLYDFSIGVSTSEAWSGAQKYGAKLAKEKRVRLGIIEPVANMEAITKHKSKKACMLAMAATSKVGYDSAEAFLKTVGLKEVESILYPIIMMMGEFDPNLIASPGGSKEMLKEFRDRKGVTQLAILDSTGHASVKARPLLCAKVALDFLHRSQYLHRVSSKV